MTLTFDSIIDIEFFFPITFHIAISTGSVNIQDVEEVSKSHEYEKNNAHKLRDVANCIGYQSNVLSWSREKSHPIKNFNPQKEYCYCTYSSYLPHFNWKFFKPEDIMNHVKIIAWNANGDEINNIPIITKVGPNWCK